MVNMKKLLSTFIFGVYMMLFGCITLMPASAYSPCHSNPNDLPPCCEIVMDHIGDEEVSGQQGGITVSDQSETESQDVLYFVSKTTDIHKIHCKYSNYSLEIPPDIHISLIKSIKQRC